MIDTDPPELLKLPSWWEIYPYINLDEWHKKYIEKLSMRLLMLTSQIRNTMENEYSKWALLDKLYESKRRYYGDGKSTSTDREYDALERSLVAIHGQVVLDTWSCVGYDSRTHSIIRDNLSQVKEEM